MGDVRASSALVLALVAAGCFTPDLGDGSVACGANALCPPHYFCHAADQRCYKTPDTSIVDMSMPDDEGGVGPDLMSTDLKGADLSSCTKAACGLRNCGTIPDECGGVETCGGGCPSPKTCGGGNPGTANICAGGPACMPKTSCQTGECGIISDGCSSVLTCPGCTGGKTCGADNLCH